MDTPTGFKVVAGDINPVAGPWAPGRLLRPTFDNACESKPSCYTANLYLEYFKGRYVLGRVSEYRY